MLLASGNMGSGRPRGGRFNMVRILVVADHAVMRRGLRALFQARQDFEVCAEASDGREAVELALQHKPDVTILDVSRPNINGTEVIRQIRKGTPGTEVMVFTGHDGENEMREVLHAGARGYVLKSEGDEQIVRGVEALARHNAFFSDRVSKAVFEMFLDQTGSHDGAGPLTARERQVVQLIAEGNSNKKTARLLSISVKTVETHRSALMRKLGTHSTAELVRCAFREGLAQP
jgi:DNA-binding NarL/FixJ family response regulator